MTGFFEEAPGVRSSMRLMCFMSLCLAITIALGTLVLIYTDDIQTVEFIAAIGVVLIAPFLGAAFGSKMVTKQQDVKEAVEMKKEEVKETVEMAKAEAPVEIAKIKEGSGK